MNNKNQRLLAKEKYPRLVLKKMPATARFTHCREIYFLREPKVQALREWLETPAHDYFFQGNERYQLLFDLGKDTLEVDISELTFHNLKMLSDGGIKKSVWLLESEGQTWRLHQYHDNLEGLIIAELLRDQNPNGHPDAPVIEELKDADITDDGRYAERFLALQPK